MIDEPAQLKLIILTGLSGAGKGTALKNLEDLGFFCVDNMPTSLLPKFTEMAMQSKGAYGKIVFGFDIREPRFTENLFPALQHLRKMGLTYEILFLEASDEELVKRFSATRRKHPLGTQRDVLEEIREERSRLRPIREQADHLVDTSDLTVHGLRDYLFQLYRDMPDGHILSINIIAFGFKYGVPVNADMIFDVRFLQNPHFVETLRPLTGKDQPVIDHIRSDPRTQVFLDKLTDLHLYLIPEFLKEKKAYLTIGIGCTGGKHRSVFMANHLGTAIKKHKHLVRITHRDIDRE